MGLPEPDDSFYPHEPESATPGPPAPPPPAAPSAPRAPDANRADWLCGPEEGIEAEIARREREEGGIQRPTLLRPATPAPLVTSGEGAAEHAGGSQVGPPPDLPLAPKVARRFGAVQPEVGGSDFVSGPSMMAWDPGPSSVPAMRRETRRVPVVREPTRDFPMDDAEERARASAWARENDAAASAGQPHVVVDPEAFNVAGVAVPWWMQVPHAIATDRRLQVMVAAVVVALLALALWPRGEQPASLASLRKHPDRFNGVGVKVEGRVGDVFQVGQGYAFYLLEGRDTLVVFTRTRHPVPRQHLTLRGIMSTGYLDGQARSALFESNE
jgi:hypothetical protein